MEASIERSSAAVPSPRVDTAPERPGRRSWLQEVGPGPIVLALTIIGAAWRFSTLDVQSLNVNEADTFLLLHHSFTGMLSHLSSTESSPPLYYMLAWVWVKVFGLSTAGLRSFSAIVGTATIPVMYLVGRQVGTRVGLWAAAITTVSSSMFFYSQETRCYPLLILFSAAAYGCWLRALADPSTRRLWLWAGISSLALLTHYFAAFLFLPEALILARRVSFRRMWAPAGAVVLVGLALVPLAVSERADGKTNWIEELSLSGRVAESVKVLTTGKYTALVLPAVVLLILLSASSVALLRKHGSPRERAAGRDALIVAVVALGLPLFLAVAHIIDIFDGTNMVAVWVPLTVLVACGLGVARARLASTAIGLAICAIGVALICSTIAIPVYQRDDWRDVAHALGPSASPRAIVIVPRNIDGLKAYLANLTTVDAPTVAAHELDFVALRVRRTVGPPLAPGVTRSAPAGFRFAGVKKAETYAISRFLALGSGDVTVAALRRLKGEPAAEVILQP